MEGFGEWLLALSQLCGLGLKCTVAWPGFCIDVGQGSIVLSDDSSMPSQFEDAVSRLEDQEIIAKIKTALQEDANGVSGYVTWKRIAWEWVAKNLDGQTRKSMAEILLQYVQAGNKIDQVKERRGFDSEFHYDFRPRIGELDVYVETVLVVSRTGPIISIVNVHLK